MLSSRAPTALVTLRSGRRCGLLAAAALAGLTVVSGAQAHVSLVPDRIDTTSEATITVLAPTEHEHPQPMVGLTLSLPDGMTVIDGAARGWRFALERGAATWRVVAAAAIAAVLRLVLRTAFLLLAGTRRSGDRFAEPGLIASPGASALNRVAAFDCRRAIA